MAAVWGATDLGHGTLVGWEIQSVTVSDENKRGTAPDKIGNEAASKLYDDTQQVTTTYKATVKMTFAKGASLDDPAGLFNASLEGGTRRAIDFHEGDRINETALKALIRAAVALNISTSARRRGAKT